MRKFKCFDCNYTWELPHGEGGRGIEQSCPKCGSNNIRRADKGRFLGRWRGRRIVGQIGQTEE